MGQGCLSMTTDAFRSVMYPTLKDMSLPWTMEAVKAKLLLPDHYMIESIKEQDNGYGNMYITIWLSSPAIPDVPTGVVCLVSPCYIHMTDEITGKPIVALTEIKFMNTYQNDQYIK